MVAARSISSCSPLTVSASRCAGVSFTPWPARQRAGCRGSGQEVGDRGRGERCEQDAAAVVPGGDQHAVGAGPTDPGACCPRWPGRRPAAASSSSSSSTAGTMARASQSSSCTAPACTVGVVASLLDRGADHDGTVAARHQVDRMPPHEPAYSATEEGSEAAPGTPRRRMCPLTGRTSGTPADSRPAMPRSPVPAARTTWSAPRRRPSSRTSSGPASSAATHGALDGDAGARGRPRPGHRAGRGCRPGGRPAPPFRRGPPGSGQGRVDGTPRRCSGATRGRAGGGSRAGRRGRRGRTRRARR